MIIDYTIDLGLAGERDVTVEVDYTPYEKGYYTGAPEDCYPASDEEISVISVKAGDTDLTKLLAEALEGYDNFLEAVREEAMPDPYEPEYREAA